MLLMFFRLDLFLDDDDQLEDLLLEAVGLESLGFSCKIDQICKTVYFTGTQRTPEVDPLILETLIKDFEHLNSNLLRMVARGTADSSDLTELCTVDSFLSSCLKGCTTSMTSSPPKTVVEDDSMGKRRRGQRGKLNIVYLILFFPISTKAQSTDVQCFSTFS
jgi:hypothetical protein